MKYGRIYKAIIVLIAAFLVVSVGARVFGHRQAKDQEPEAVSESEMSSIVQEKSDTKEIEDYTGKELHGGNITYNEEIYPLESTVNDESLQSEAYSPYDDELQTYYFTNTENTIDVNGVLPLEAHESLGETASAYLRLWEITEKELYCIDGSVKVDEVETTFQVAAGDTIITMTYNKDRHIWFFDY